MAPEAAGLLTCLLTEVGQPHRFKDTGYFEEGSEDRCVSVDPFGEVTSPCLMGDKGSQQVPYHLIALPSGQQNPKQNSCNEVSEATSQSEMSLQNDVPVGFLGLHAWSYGPELTSAAGRH